MPRDEQFLVLREGARQVTPEDFTKTLRDKLAVNRQPVHRGEQFAHPRGWNDCLDFVERCIKEIEGHSAP